LVIDFYDYFRNIFNVQIKEYQIMNGNMHKEIENLKKNETLLREDLQVKDLEIGRMMQKLNRKVS